MSRLYSHPRECRKILLGNYLCIGFVPGGMTGRPGCRTLEMIGGSSASYLARTPCVPLFSTLFNRGGNRRAFRLPGAGGGAFPLYGETFAWSHSVSKTQTFGSGYFRWGRGLPREGVGAKKFGMSLETREGELSWRDSREFAGISRWRPKSLSGKKKAHKLLTHQLLENSVNPETTSRLTRKNA